MPELKNTSLKLLDWYKSIGVDICIQNIPRKRFKSISNNSNKNIEIGKINNLKNLEKQIFKLDISELKSSATKLVFLCSIFLNKKCITCTMSCTRQSFTG